MVKGHDSIKDQVLTPPALSLASEIVSGLKNKTQKTTKSKSEQKLDTDNEDNSISDPEYQKIINNQSLEFICDKIYSIETNIYELKTTLKYFFFLTIAFFVFNFLFIYFIKDV